MFSNLYFRVVFVIPTNRKAARRNLLFSDSFCGAVRETQIPRAKNALEMTSG